MTQYTRRKVLTLGALAVSTSLALAACSPGSPSTTTSSAATVSKAAFDKAMSTPTTLTFWTWLPDIKKQVGLFEKQYPDIKVNVENVAQGTAEYTKLRTALKAGSGAPDVVQIEYPFLSSFVVTNDLLDLTPYGAAAEKSKFVPWVWNQVSSNGGVYAYPADSGPLGNLYRADIMEKAGITSPPTTWDEYAADAAIVKAKTGSYISDFAPSGGQIVAFLWQAGAKPFGYDGKKAVTVDVNSAAAKKVMTYWKGLIDKDLVGTAPDFNDAWYQGLTTGKYAGWLTAAWGPIFLQGTAASTSGKWRAAPLPQWDASNPATGNWGGSSNAVVKSSKNKIAAAELARWINVESAPTLVSATEQFQFPTTNSVLEDTTWVDQKSKFFGGQEVNKEFAAISKTVDTKFQWLPYNDYADASFVETVGKAITEKGDIVGALDDWQTALVKYGTDQGFDVNK